MNFPKRQRRIAGSGSLWRCVICDARTRDPQEHWDAHHTGIKPFSMQVAWDCFAFLSNARRSQRPEKAEPVAKIDNDRLW